MFPDIMRDDVFRLETQRLWLRWPRAKDAAAIADAAGRREVAEMTARIPHPYPAGGAEDWVMRAREANLAGDEINLVISLASGRREVVGQIGARRSLSGGVEIGYLVSPDHWGRGYATEAVHALVDAVFLLTNEPALDAAVRVVNSGSQGVLRKCGFSVVGSGLETFPARGGLYPVDYFRLERKVWSSLKRWAQPDLVLPPRRPVATPEWSADALTA